MLKKLKSIHFNKVVGQHKCEHESENYHIEVVKMRQPSACHNSIYIRERNEQTI